MTQQRRRRQDVTEDPEPETNLEENNEEVVVMTTNANQDKMAKFEDWLKKQDSKKMKKDAEKFAVNQLKANYASEYQAAIAEYTSANG